MTHLLALTATLSLALSGAALAQDATWTGSYGGVSMATSTGTHDYDDGDDLYDLEGPSFGVFAGHNWANGNLLYGVEGALTFGGVYEVEQDESTTYKDEYEYQRFLDLKGRLGYALNNVVVYGTLGVSRTAFESDIGGSEYVSIGTTGMLYGLGADYRVSDRYFVGAEYLRRNFDYFDPGQDVDIDAEIDTLTLRAGIKF